jgi:hypothetical protein
LLSPNACTYLGAAHSSNEADEKLQILDALVGVRLTGTDLASKTGIPSSTVMKRLKSLNAEDRVNSNPGPGKGSPLIWFTVIQS